VEVPAFQAIPSLRFLRTYTWNFRLGRLSHVIKSFWAAFLALLRPLDAITNKRKPRISELISPWLGLQWSAVCPPDRRFCRSIRSMKQSGSKGVGS
jgi:hypothetical protein